MAGIDVDKMLRALHVTVIVVGTLLMAVAFSYDAVWFDEAYSLALAQHPIPEIVRIGAADVHPVLYYLALHCAQLLLGPDVIASRMLSVAGVGVLSLLGFTHVRRDLGEGCGLAFSILAFLVPWSAFVGSQIRMYSWLAVTVMVVAIYGWRIVEGIASGLVRVPLQWWALMAAASVASAYLHYYGAITSFVVQAMVLVAILRSKGGGRRKALALWSAFAAAAVLLYSPWVLVAIGQAETVRQGFWIDLGFPDAFAELVLFPFYVAFYPDLLGQWNEGLVGELTVCLFLFVAVAAAMVVYGLGAASLPRGASSTALSSHAGSSKSPEDRLAEPMANAEEGRPCEGASRSVTTGTCSPMAFQLGAYLGTVLVALALNFIMGEPVIYHRYLVSAVGPVIAAISIALVTVWRRRVIRAIACVAIALAASNVYAIACTMGWSPQNGQAIDAYAEACEDAIGLNDGSGTMVFSDDILIAGVIAVSDEGEPIVYMSESEAYRAFAPRIVMDEDWAGRLDGYEGVVVYVGYDEEHLEEFASAAGGTVIETREFRHPYSYAIEEDYQSSANFTYSLVEVHGSRR